MPVTINNTTLTFNDGTTQTTSAAVKSVNGQIGNVSVPAVTAVATGNGLQGGTITTTGTLSIACPSFATVGSYIFAAFDWIYGTGTQTVVQGADYTWPVLQYASIGCDAAGGTTFYAIGDQGPAGPTNVLPGTWKYMGQTATFNRFQYAIACRVA